MRIVAGLAKGRRLAGPAGATRPTSDRAREALFNSLAASLDLDGARVLDLYAGTGAVGLEALSRGASEAVFVENDRAALAILRRNIDTVGRPGASVAARTVAGYLRDEPVEPFDLVFADPPYDLPDDDVYGLVRVLTTPVWLSPEGRIVIERRAGSTWDPPVGLVTPAAEKRYGDSLLWYFRRR